MVYGINLEFTNTKTIKVYCSPWPWSDNACGDISWNLLGEKITAKTCSGRQKDSNYVDRLKKMYPHASKPAQADIRFDKDGWFTDSPRYIHYRTGHILLNIPAPDCKEATPKKPQPQPKPVPIPKPQVSDAGVKPKADSGLSSQPVVKHPAKVPAYLINKAKEILPQAEELIVNLRKVKLEKRANEIAKIKTEVLKAIKGVSEKKASQTIRRLEELLLIGKKELREAAIK